MATLQQNLVDIRYMLDEPAPNNPSDRILWQLLQDAVVHHRTQLQNTAAQWDVNEWQLVTAQSQEDYLITATDFGKPFWVHTYDPTNPQLPRVEVPFSQMQNTDMFYQGPAQLFTSASNIFSASVISFYRQNQQWYARLTPIPGGTATYNIWYETDPGGQLNLSDSPGLTPFHHLIRAQTAFNALPYCSWGDLSVGATEASKAAAWERKTKALAVTLGAQVAMYQRQFDIYKATLSQAGVERRQAYGEWYMNATEVTGGGFFGPSQFGLNS